MALYVASGISNQVGNWKCVEDTSHYEYAYRGLPPIKQRRAVSVLVYEARWVNACGPHMAAPDGYQLENSVKSEPFGQPLSCMSRLTFTRKGIWEDVED